MEKIKLFCIPYAGGSATNYLRWKRYSDSAIEIVPIELKGRGGRSTTAFYENFQEVVDDVYNSIKFELGKSDYALFGHSFGSMIVYEVIKKIRQAKDQDPVHVFFSGCGPPYIRKNKKLSNMSDDELKEEIFSYGGTTKEFFEDENLLKNFMPILKADIKIMESRFQAEDKDKYNFDVTIFNGVEDVEYDEKDIRQWEKCTLKKCNRYKFEGGHFFINEKTEDVLKVINNLLNSYHIN